MMAIIPLCQAGMLSGASLRCMISGRSARWPKAMSTHPLRSMPTRHAWYRRKGLGRPSTAGSDANPMGCQGEPEDLVPTVCFPVFPKVDCTTGTVNPVAGERRRLRLRL